MAEQDKPSNMAQDVVQNYISDAENRNLSPSQQRLPEPDSVSLNRVLPGQQPDAAPKYQAVKDGEHIAYHRDGQEIFRDSGDRITMKSGSEHDTANVEAALRLAVEKYGDKGIILNGSDAFKLQAMRVMAEKGINIKLGDKAQSALFEAMRHKHGQTHVASALESDKAAPPRTAKPSTLLSDDVRKNGVNPVSNIGTKMTGPEYAAALQKLGGEGVGRIELPKQHCGYCGKIIQASDTHIVQKIDKNFAIAHDVTKIANGREILAMAEKGQLRNVEMNVNYNEKVAEAKQVKFNLDDAKSIIANSNTWAAKNISSPQSREAFGKIVRDLATARTQAQEFKKSAPVQVVRAPAQSPAKPLPRAR